MADDRDLLKLEQALFQAVTDCNLTAYQTARQSYRDYHRQQGLAWTYPGSNLVSYLLRQVVNPKHNASDQASLVKALLVDQAVEATDQSNSPRDQYYQARYDQYRIFELACLYSSPDTVKVFLATGFVIDQDFFESVLTSRFPGPAQPDLIAKIVLLLQHCQFNLDQIFTWGNFWFDASAIDLTGHIFKIDDLTVTTTILLHSHLTAEATISRQVLGCIDQPYSNQTLGLLIRLGLICDHEPNLSQLIQHHLS